MIQKPAAKTGNPQTVQGTAAFSRSIALLQLIAEAPEPPTTAQLVSSSGLSRPTVHRMLKSLVLEQLVETRSDRTHIVGIRMLQLAGKAQEQNEILRYAKPEIDWLSSKTQETIHLAVLGNSELVYIHKKDSPHAVRIASSPGGQVPMHASAIGKSVLAWLPEPEQTTTLNSLNMRRLTRYTTTSPASLKKELQKIRNDGYSIAHQESDLEIECYGVCLFDRDGHPVGGIGLSVPLFRRNQDLQVYIQPLLTCGQRITRQLGGHPR